MKKILCGIAIVLGMVLATSCGNSQKKSAVEEEAVDTTVVVETPADTLQVVAEK